MSLANTTPHRKSTILQKIGKHWFETFLIVYGLWIFVPFLAPLFMHIGWTGAGKAIYFMYSFFCHQLPERSYFLFGQKTMYSLSEIQSAWKNTDDFMILRQFTGNATLGWKIAWSDRMISFYTSIWFFAVLWRGFFRRIKPISWLALALLLLPMALDGSTHFISDFAGMGQGFRDTNTWLALLTNDSLPATFYAGDSLGSFNSLMRLMTGLLAGLGIVWLVFPYILQTQIYNQQLDENSYAKAIEQIKRKNSHSSGG